MIKQCILSIMMATCAAVNFGYVDGISTGDAFTGTMIFLAYSGWALK